MQLPILVTKNAVYTSEESIVNLFQMLTLKGMSVDVKAKRVLLSPLI